MRLSNHQCEVFIHVISKYISQNAQLLLFGSRVNDKEKGGDIDLMLIVEDDQIKEHIIFKKVDILSQIKSEIGEQKIDLIICTKEDITNSAFLRSAKSKSVLLKEWFSSAQASTGGTGGL